VLVAAQFDMYTANMLAASSELLLHCELYCKLKQNVTAESVRRNSCTELACVSVVVLTGTTVLYLRSLLCCAGVGDWEGAITLLDEMRTLKLQPDERIYGAAMRACRYTVRSFMTCSNCCISMQLVQGLCCA
jgi:pentatricopeptide repeat protein